MLSLTAAPGTRPLCCATQDFSAAGCKRSHPASCWLGGSHGWVPSLELGFGCSLLLCSVLQSSPSILVAGDPSRRATSWGALQARRRGVGKRKKKGKKSWKPESATPWATAPMVKWWHWHWQQQQRHRRRRRKRRRHERRRRRCCLRLIDCLHGLRRSSCWQWKPS